MSIKLDGCSNDDYCRADAYICGAFDKWSHIQLKPNLCHAATAVMVLIIMACVSLLATIITGLSARTVSSSLSCWTVISGMLLCIAMVVWVAAFQSNLNDDLGQGSSSVAASAMALAMAARPNRTLTAHASVAMGANVPAKKPPPLGAVLGDGHHYDHRLFSCPILQFPTIDCASGDCPGDGYCDTYINKGGTPPPKASRAVECAPADLLVSFARRPVLGRRRLLPDEL